MENASKALLMAAGVLIGVLILALAVYLLTNFGMTSAEVHKQKDINEINKFNTQFTSYEGKECRIQDLVSVVNLAINNNNNYSLDAEAGNSYYITVNIKSVKSNLEKQDINLDELIKNNLDKKYKCTTDINSKTQRVYKVTFEEI